ncbi:MAG TPA: sensor histidine kinase [Roseiarcus sp.]|jgi:two-component sensor histidine kinase|nr:sensor histidine kinase [Roseiarcus sp.]
MALHELATNAAKYGALSCHDGRIEIHWRISPSPKRTFELTWSESGGPPVIPPSHEGFGSRLIKGALTADLGATTSVDYAPSGAVWRFAAPLDNIV